MTPRPSRTLQALKLFPRQFHVVSVASRRVLNFGIPPANVKVASAQTGAAKIARRGQGGGRARNPNGRDQRTLTRPFTALRPDLSRVSTCNYAVQHSTPPSMRLSIPPPRKYPTWEGEDGSRCRLGYLRRDGMW